jgi:hypothetical protein
LSVKISEGKGKYLKECTKYLLYKIKNLAPQLEVSLVITWLYDFSPRRQLFITARISFVEEQMNLKKETFPTLGSRSTKIAVTVTNFDTSVKDLRFPRQYY